MAAIGFVRARASSHKSVPCQLIPHSLSDVTKSENIHGERTKFKHPFFQAVGMFMGEMLCLLAFKYMVWRAREEQANKAAQKLLPTATDSETGQDATELTEAEELLRVDPEFSPFYFFPAAMCDMTATSECACCACAMPSLELLAEPRAGLMYVGLTVRRGGQKAATALRASLCPPLCVGAPL